MIRNLKVLGLSLVAVFAMGALTASAASATDLFTTSTGGKALLTGVSHNHVFNIPGSSKFECTTSKFAATVNHGDTFAKADVEYLGKLNETPHLIPCNATIGTVTIDMNGCEYNLSGETTGKDVAATDATVSIECPVGASIAITGPFGCKVNVPSQTPTEGGVTYTNLPNHPGGAAIEVKATATGLTYTSNCIGVPAAGNNAVYNGTVIMTGYGDTEGLPTPVTEGARVGVSTS